MAILLANKALGKLSQLNAFFERLVKGGRRRLYGEGRFFESELRNASVTETDIREQLRLLLNTGQLDEVTGIFVEKSGKISFTRK
ncbi:hypothetical protein EPD60_08445 [Flaviaesturariibacter flavus]|uniref:DUF421 domain-containing protein n=1 Tax=Flaviaesturariibacter flavus TaxID=2502780 RepID=A0A4R1BAQ8_9BACT|nr:YetF domain-containing protein [Flaviaesturariibacter flavus]TCJ14034.1 hypothetical protein EPD60_08445 [Flaviaesturariibacter flavus]